MGCVRSLITSKLETKPFPTLQFLACLFSLSKSTMSIHIYPDNDWIEHDTNSFDCICEPTVEFKDPETDEWYEQPLVIHNAIDPDFPK